MMDFRGSLKALGGFALCLEAMGVKGKDLWARTEVSSKLGAWGTCAPSSASGDAIPWGGAPEGGTSAPAKARRRSVAEQ